MIDRTLGWLGTLGMIASLAACGAAAPERGAGPRAAKGDEAGGMLVPEEAWNELSEAGGGDPEKVVVFSQYGEVKALNVETLTVTPLDQYDNWPALHQCLEQRDYRSEDQRKVLYVDREGQNGANVVWMDDREYGKRERLTHFGKPTCWYTTYDAEGNPVRGHVSASDSDLMWTWYDLTFDPAYAPGNHMAAVVTTEEGADCVVDGRFIVNGQQAIWLVQTELRNHVGDNPCGGTPPFGCDLYERDDGFFFKTKLVSTGAAEDVRHPSWAPDRNSIVFHVGSFEDPELALKPVQWHDDRGRWLPRRPTEEQTRQFSRLGVRGKDPVWVKHRDLPADDAECQL